MCALACWAMLPFASRLRSPRGSASHAAIALPTTIAATQQSHAMSGAGQEGAPPVGGLSLTFGQPRWVVGWGRAPQQPLPMCPMDLEAHSCTLARSPAALPVELARTLHRPPRPPPYCTF